MGSLLYYGPSGGSSVPTGLGDQGDVDTAKALALTEAQVDSRISAKLANYTTTTYVDQQDALRSTRAYVDQQDALRVKTATKGQPNGPVDLDSSGRFTLARVPSAYRTYQRGPRAYYSPSSYPTQGYATSSASQATLYTCAIADPGYSYKLLVWAYHEVMSANPNNAYAAINVRVGSSTGQVIARGFGPWRSSGWGCLPVVPDMTVGQTARTGATTLYVYGYRAGGGDTVTFSTFLAHMAVMVMPA